MKEKTADQIQAEIDLMRLAYRQQCEEEDRPRFPPLLHAVPYLACVGFMILGVIWLLIR